MILLSVLTTLVGFHYLLKANMRETILISELKTNQIRSQTIAMLKQFDLTLTNNDIWSSSATLSDLISDPDEYQVDFYDDPENVNRIAVDAYELGVRLNSSSIEEQRAYNYSKVAAYISPEPLPTEVRDNFEYQDGLKVCSLSQVFQNYGFN